MTNNWLRQCGRRQQSFLYMYIGSSVVSSEFNSVNIAHCKYSMLKSGIFHHQKFLTPCSQLPFWQYFNISLNHTSIKRLTLVIKKKRQKKQIISIYQPEDEHHSYALQSVTLCWSFFVSQDQNPIIVAKTH